MSAPLINEALCKQLVAEYFRRVRCDEKPAVILRELLQVTYSQGYTAGGAQALADDEWAVPLAVAKQRAEVVGHCSEGDRCLCGGDLPRIREGCGNWRKP